MAIAANLKETVPKVEEALMLELPTSKEQRQHYLINVLCCSEPLVVSLRCQLPQTHFRGAEDETEISPPKHLVQPQSSFRTTIHSLDIFSPHSEIIIISAVDY